MRFQFTTLAMLFCGALLSGCSEKMNSDPAAIGQSIGENVTEFAQGVGSGVDTKLQVNVELSAAIKQAGVSSSIAKRKVSIGDPEETISVYLISTQTFQSTLIAKAYNANDQEIGRGTTDVDLGEDDAQYVEFKFPREMDSKAAVLYKLDVRSSDTNSKTPDK